MFFTPFAFVQQPFAVAVAPSLFTEYYIGGVFTTYASSSQPYFRMLDSTGSISSSFNIGTGFDNAVYSAATQSDGKIMLGGSFTSYSGSASNNTRIIRLNTDGTKDTTFNPGTAGVNAQINSLAIQADGKIVIVGGFSQYSGSSGKNFIARINTNGTADTGSSWNTGVGFDTTTNAIVIQPDQKIVIGGSFSSYSGSAKGFIVRLNTNGTADTGSSWNQGVGLNGQVNYLSIQSDGKIIAGGGFTTYSGSSSTRIIRLNTDGTRDATFNVGTGGANSTVYTTEVQSDGKILIGGLFTQYSGSTSNYIARINTNGTKDNTFNVGTGFDSAVYNLYVQPDQKIIATGLFTSYSGSVANNIIRLNPDGTIDTTFNQKLSINAPNTNKGGILQLSNGSIILSGLYTGNKAGYLTTLDSAGNLTPQSIVSSYGFNASVVTAVKQSNGKILAGGTFSTYSGSTRNYITSLNSDGTVDTGSTWNQGVGFNSTVSIFATQSDGKILVGGAFTTYSGSSNITRIARLNTNGTLDTTFNPGTTGANSTVNSLAVQSDGKILIGGAFTTYSGSNTYRLARANTNGTKDLNFNMGALVSINSNVNTIAVQSDGKILIGGAFTTYSGSTKNYIARINTDGTADTGSSWNQGVGFTGTPVNTFAIQSDGKILAGGNFTAYSGSASNNTRIIRLNTDGTKDTTFNPGTQGFNSAVQTIIMESGSNQIIVGGQFTTYSGSTANRIVKLNSNGTIDNTFTPVSGGFNSIVNVIIPY
jgi:uncharacterized delta-60 repeat protein